MLDIKTLLEEIGITVDKAHYEKLLRYRKELIFWNPKYGLVNYEDEDELDYWHFVDSLAPMPLINSHKYESLADLGSGPGLPGIPLAIFNPDKHIHLVERSSRRVKFLKATILQLGLENVHIIDRNLGEVQSKFDLITFRAFRPFSEDIVKDIKNIAHKDTWICAYKGKREHTEQEITPYKEQILNSNIDTLPMKGRERHLLSFQFKF
ncbi:16S rRNA (guanine(527)-N(7))-methyltransferase RsmG [Spirochaeta cellobiosiphila]|uniref:16S rRNA (guanine(527)-N(7))-methyltransferase RsmG n=1 Tax=Spirochaeta cellobiosiphila TaxID=504483 RepID=UPI000413AE67|nr:16S rRNA (guanine(527)-N(7))-methyltransferase RsmG [Spirochaeta cellobiosiphila]